MAPHDTQPTRAPRGTITEREPGVHVAFLREGPSARNGFVMASFLLGFGLGGFLDGIFLHQLLQWHNMISNVLPPNTLANLRTNVFADGLFNLAMWGVVAAGVAVMWRTLQKGQSRLIGTRSFIGWWRVGWGALNHGDTVTIHARRGR
ncbi:MAG: DUF2243 domain-containing protein, partial [Candidatus Sericytochromatia bacterium]